MTQLLLLNFSQDFFLTKKLQITSIVSEVSLFRYLSNDFFVVNLKQRFKKRIHLILESKQEKALSWEESNCSSHTPCWQAHEKATQIKH